MEYVIELLQRKLNEELRALDIANQMTEGRGFSMPRETQNAFDESRELAYVRIPQLKEAISILTVKSK